MRNEAELREIKKAIKSKLFSLSFYDSNCRCASEATGWWRQCRAEHRGTVSRPARRRVFPPVVRWRLPWCCEVRRATVVKFAFLWSFHDQNAIKVIFYLIFSSFLLAKMTIKVKNKLPAYIWNDIWDESDSAFMWTINIESFFILSQHMPRWWFFYF